MSMYDEGMERKHVHVLILYSFLFSLKEKRVHTEVFD